MATESHEIYDNGVLVSSTQVPIPDNVANERTLRDRAATALANNRDFLAITTPTNAQVVAQVKALTRQVQALIRLQIQDMSGTD